MPLNFGAAGWVAHIPQGDMWCAAGMAILNLCWRSGDALKRSPLQLPKVFKDKATSSSMSNDQDKVDKPLSPNVRVGMVQTHFVEGTPHDEALWS